MVLLEKDLDSSKLESTWSLTLAMVSEMREMACSSDSCLRFKDLTSFFRVSIRKSEEWVSSLEVLGI